MYLAKIYVTYKPSILDPQGEVIKSALHRMSYDDVADVTQGKYFEVKLNATDESAATKQAEALTQELLINPNTETYRIDIVTVTEA